MRMPQLHFFLRPLNDKEKTRRRKPHEMRDLAAAVEMVGAFQGLGYAYGSIKFNSPPLDPAQQDLLEVDVSDVGTGDLLVMIGRWPLSDLKQGDPKPMRSGFTSLERMIQPIVERCFSELARSRAKIAEHFHPFFRAGFENRREVFFGQRERSTYKILNACNGTPRRIFRGPARTAGFIIRQPKLWENGPDLLMAFAPDGVSTLAFAHLLRKRHLELLQRDGFTMVDLITRPVPKRTGDLRWALDWQVEPVLHAPIPALQSGPMRKASQPRPLALRASRPAAARTGARPKEQSSQRP